MRPSCLLAPIQGNAQFNGAQTADTIAVAEQDLETVVRFIHPAQGLLPLEKQKVEMHRLPDNLRLLLRGQVHVRKVDVVRVRGATERGAESSATRVAGAFLDNGQVTSFALFLADGERYRAA